MRVLYHLTLSPSARKVRLVLAEKNLDFTLKLEKVWERRGGGFSPPPPPRGAGGFRPAGAPPPRTQAGRRDIARDRPRGRLARMAPHRPAPRGPACLRRLYDTE